MERNFLRQKYRTLPKKVHLHVLQVYHNSHAKMVQRIEFLLRLNDQSVSLIILNTRRNRGLDQLFFVLSAKIRRILGVRQCGRMFILTQSKNAPNLR